MRRSAPIIAALLSPGSALAATYTVATDGSGDFSTLSAAIAAAKSGDRVEVAAGTYTETISFAGKDLELVGVAGSSSTFLDGAGSSPRAVLFASGETSAALLQGFTITNPGQRALAITDASPTVVDVVVSGAGSSTATGGGILINGGAPTFEDCRLDGNTGKLGGHVYVMGSATPQFNDTEFTDGEAEDQGGAVYVETGELTVVGGTFDNNYAVANGGAITLGVGAGLTLDGVTLTDNHSDAAAGGAIYGAGTNDLLITSSELSSNYPYEYSSGYGGGALYMTSGTLAVSDTVFDANYAYYGAAMMLYGTTATFEGNTFSTNYAYYGGAIYLSSSSYLSDTGSLYDTNTSYYYGAAIYAYYNFTLSFDAATFSENAAYYGYGGGIFASSYGYIGVENSTFSDNYAYYSGGGIYADTLLGDINVNASAFTDNVATYGYGGAVYSYYYSNTNASQSTFTRNEALYSGGALYCYYYCGLNVRGSDFTYNVASNLSGGAVYWNPLSAGYDMNFVGNDLSGNVSRYEGGGLYTYTGGSVLVQGNHFDGNLLDDDSFGGGLHASGYGDLVVWDNTLTNNESIIGAGAFIGAGADDDATAWLVNNVLAENAANRVGGGIALVDVGDLTFENNTLLGNQALEGGGALYIYDSVSLIRNNLFAQTVDGEAVTFDDAEALIQSTITYNDWFDNADGDQGGDLGTITLDASNLWVDPQLARYSRDGDADNDAYVLARTSPCVDAGDPDLEDPDGTRSDIGALGGPFLLETDQDEDGYSSAVDCDEDDPSVHPGADDAWYDGVNSDCGYGSDYDQDGDGVDALDYDGDDCDDLDANTTDCAEVDSGGDDPIEDTGAPDSAPEDTGGLTDAGGVGDTAKAEPGGCACATSGDDRAPGGLGLGALALACVGLARRRRG